MVKEWLLAHRCRKMFIIGGQLLIIKEPFERIAMDIVGSLPRSQCSNRFVLVICDYATRSPEAVPLRNCLHCREHHGGVGDAKQILTDQGSNFVSQRWRAASRDRQAEGSETIPSA